MADTSVKYFHSSMAGAPTLNGTAGSLIAVLDACLVNGFGLITADSVVIAGGIATVTKSTGHPQEVGSVALVAGATVTGGSINGEQKVTAATGTTFSFAATGISNQTATGTITAKLAPATWAKTYSGTNKAAYKSTDVTATGCLLRVDDTATLTARVVGYETMSDVDTGTGVFPTTAQQSGGLFWVKSSTANATANPWMLFADGRTVYLARAYRGGNTSTEINNYELHAFGDPTPTKSGDPFACIISGELADQSASNVNNTAKSYYVNSTASSANLGLFMPRSYTGLGSSIQAARCFPSLHNNNTGSASGIFITNATQYPNPADGGLYVVPHYLFESVTFALRAVSPGFYCCPQSIPVGSFASRDSVTGVTGLPGKTLKAITCQNANTATCFVDITGPWR